MTTAEIRALMAQGQSRDTIYQEAVRQLGLWGVAFYGHRGKPGELAKLQRVWKRIVKQFEHTPRTLEELTARDKERTRWVEMADNSKLIPAI